MAQWWLSFADSNDGHFLGGICAVGDSLEEVLRESHRRGCNPGGEVKAIGSDAPHPPMFELWKLYSRADIDRLDEAVPMPDEDDDA